MHRCKNALIVALVLGALLSGYLGAMSRDGVAATLDAVSAAVGATAGDPLRGLSYGQRVLEQGPGSTSLSAGQKQAAPLQTGARSDHRLVAVAKPDEKAAPSYQRTRGYFVAKAGRRFFLNQDVANGFSTDDTFGSRLLGIGFGANIGRYFGLEVTAEDYESELFADGFGSEISEYSVLSLLGLARFRYPMMDDRLVPYLFAGAGFGISEINDKTAVVNQPGAPVFDGQDKQSDPIFAFGAGVEYFIAENLSVGAELKQVIHRTRIDANGRSQDANLDSFQAAVTTRLHIPGPPRQASDPTKRRQWWRHNPHESGLYVAAQSGWAIFNDESITSVFTFSDGRGKGPIFGGIAGFDYNHYLGFELAIETHESGVDGTDPAGGGTFGITEYRTTSVIPRIRAKYPVLQDRLVPYVVAGAGMAWNTTGEDTIKTLPNTLPSFSADDQSFVATAGAGVEYFIADNIALGAEVRYMYNRPEVEIGGVGTEINADALLSTGHIKLYLP